MRAGLQLLGIVWGLSLATATAAEKVWDQAAAKKMVAKVLEVEKGKTRPWNRIPWRASVDSAKAEAKKSGKPLFVFFFVEQLGPPLERCGLEGRLLRTHVLSDSTVLSHVKNNFIPVKVPMEKGKEFPLKWPALKHWSVAYGFSNEKGFAGCSVVSADLAIEFGNSGSARISQLFDSRAYDPKSFASILERAISRMKEEQSLRYQRGIGADERQKEIDRFREGMKRVVGSERGATLPPRGYSLERALELYEMAGTVDSVIGEE